MSKCGDPPHKSDVVFKGADFTLSLACTQVKRLNHLNVGKLSSHKPALTISFFSRYLLFKQ